MGIYFYAGWSAKQSRQEKGQVGKESLGQSRESFLGCTSTDGNVLYCPLNDCILRDYQTVALLIRISNASHESILKYSGYRN